jgi:response regulator RpfG family c-di-GMP phosphodiesterase
LHQKQLGKANQGLEELTRKQNEELKDLNANLEEKVKSRTEEVRQTMGFLEVAHEKLKKGFITSIRVFSNLIEMREGVMAGHSHRVAELSRAIAQQMEMKEAEVQDVFLAALLHDVGKIGLPDYLLEKPFANLTGEERIEVSEHPAKGQTALMALEQLQGAAKLIRSHHEHFDGLGFPDKLHGLEIPPGARIIALANEYDAVQIGTLLNKRLKQSDAVLYIQEGKGRRYDPAVVDAFMKVMGSSGAAQAIRESAIQMDQAKPGMVLSRDLMSSNGELLLSKDFRLDASLISQIKSFDKLGGKLIIYVYDRK